jgi:hypothetical protein
MQPMFAPLVGMVRTRLTRGKGTARGLGLAAPSESFLSAVSRVVLAPGAEDNGLAVMLGNLVRENLEAKPAKRADFAALDGRVAIVAADADVALTLVFERGAGGALTIHHGIVGIPDVTIRGSSDAILALSNMPLATRLGLPIPNPRDPAAVQVIRDLTRAMRQGELHVYGMIFHVRLVMKLTRVMSVNG